MFKRTVALAAAIWGVGCGGAAVVPGAQVPTDPGGGPAASARSQVATLEVRLDPGVSAIPLFEHGARKGGCAHDYEPLPSGGNALVVKCDVRAIVAGQEGRNLILACPNMTNGGCNDFALEILEYVKR